MSTSTTLEAFPHLVTAPDLDDYLPVRNDDGVMVYKRAYAYLRSKRQILEHLSHQLPAHLDSLSPDEQVIVSKHCAVFQLLLDSDFGALMSNVDIALEALVPLNISDHSSPVIQSIHSSLLSTLRGFSLLEPFLTVRFAEAPPRRISGGPLLAGAPHEMQGDDVAAMLVLCRICERYVPLSMIEEHSQSCALAYEAGFHVVSIHDRIQTLQRAIQRSLLNHAWPGDELRGVTHDLPLIRVVALLDQIQAIDPESPNADAALQVLATTLDSVQLKCEAATNDLIARGGALAREKLDQCGRMSMATELQRRTSFGPPVANPASHVTTLADFVFVKRISSGAYARVFLARKEKTGDVYAIKVTPRSSISQKNALKRILSERDILLQFTSPFIVTFCIIFFLTRRLFNYRNTESLSCNGIPSRRRFVFPP
jgi:hypothetical protein